ncbi:MAG: YncE family protein [Chitinophagaceae bacterium]
MSKKYLLLFFLLGVISLLIVGLYIKQKGYNITIKGKLAVVNKGSGSVTIFDMEKGKQQAELALDVEPHEITAIASDGLVVVSNYGNENKRGHSLTVINTKTNTIERIIELGDNLMPHGITNIPHTNTVLVAVEGNNSLLEVNALTGEMEKKIATQQQQSHMVTLSPGDSIAYVANSASNSISAININKGKLLQNIICGKGAVGIDVTPDGKEVWISNSIDNTITILEVPSYKLLATLKTDAEPMRLKISPGGKYCIVANSSGGNIFVFDVQTKKLLHTIVVPGKSNWIEKSLMHTPRLAGITFYPDGNYVFIANSNANKIIVINTENWKIIGNISTGKVPDGITITAVE